VNPLRQAALIHTQAKVVAGWRSQICQTVVQIKNEGSRYQRRDGGRFCRWPDRCSSLSKRSLPVIIPPHRFSPALMPWCSGRAAPEI
jgi:hypothetical protein